MNPISYSVLQYRHDRALEEAINIGVLTYSPCERRAAIEYDQHYGYLSQLYQGFDKSGFRSSMRHLCGRISEMNERLQNQLIEDLDRPFHSADQLIQSIWPDKGSSIVGLKSKFTTGHDAKSEAHILFDRLVASQRHGIAHRGRRNDEEVWDTIKSRLKSLEGRAARFCQRKIDEYLQVDYATTLKDSGRIVAIEPVAFDYLHTANVKDRTYEMVGKSVGLESRSEVEQVFVVIGEVERNSEVAKSVDWAEAYLRNSAKKTTVLREQDLAELVSALR